MLQVVLYSPVLPVRSLIKVAAAVSMETTLVRASCLKTIISKYCVLLYCGNQNSPGRLILLEWITFRLRASTAVGSVCSAVFLLLPVQGCDGPLLYFKFDDDFKSSGCEKVEAYQAGDDDVTFAWDAKARKSARFNGAAVLTVPFLKNYFANRNLDTFTVALWFKWIGNPPTLGGLVNNGDCESDPSFSIHVGDTGEVVSGHLRTQGAGTRSNANSEVFMSGRIELSQQDYFGSCMLLH